MEQNTELTVQAGERQTAQQQEVQQTVQQQVVQQTAQQVTQLQMRVNVGFRLLNVELVGVMERHADESVEFLVEPAVNYSAEPFTLADLVNGLNAFFRGLAGEGSFSLSVDEVFANLQDFLENISLDRLSIAIHQVFFHVTKPKNGKTVLEYAFSLKLANATDVTPKEFTLASIDSVAFGIWNTDNKKILSRMGLLSVADLL